jgi:hypothetical protein
MIRAYSEVRVAFGNATDAVVTSKFVKAFSVECAFLVVEAVAMRISGAVTGLQPFAFAVDKLFALWTHARWLAILPNATDGIQRGAGILDALSDRRGHIARTHRRAVGQHYVASRLERIRHTGNNNVMQLQCSDSQGFSLRCQSQCKRRIPWEYICLGGRRSLRHTRSLQSTWRLARTRGHLQGIRRSQGRC